MGAVDKINSIISNIDSNSKNRTETVYLNRVKEEFITFDDIITIPQIPVKELSYELAAGIVEDISEVIPEFLYGHRLLEKRQPPSDVHSLHFMRVLEGKVLDFAHMLRVHLQFGGDTSAIIRRGTSDVYPSFITNRVYYTSRLVPRKKEAADGAAVDSLRLKERLVTESDQYFHTFAIFEDMDTSGMTQKLLENIPADVFGVSTGLYPFLVFDYFTACMNILYPSAPAIERAANMFEPLFFIVAGGFVPPENLAPGIDLAEAFDGRLVVTGDSVAPTKRFSDELRRHFSGIRVEKDDELAIKGWWRFVFEK